MRLRHLGPRENLPGVGRFTETDLRSFARDGYVTLRTVVQENLLAAADREIDELVDETPPQEGDRGAGVNAWFPSVARLPACEAVLRRSNLLDIACELVAPNRLDHAFDHIQVSTTMPPWSHIPGGPHIDGHAPWQDPPGSFTMLAGVLLTDQTDDQSGNLWVWPGSHLVHQRLFHERGTTILRTTGGHAGSLDPPPELGKPVPVKGKRGDVVLAHFLLGHNKGGNTAPRQRRTIYYRLAVPGHAERWEATFLDAWTEYPPMTRIRRHAGA